MVFAATGSKRRNSNLHWMLIRLAVLSAAAFLAFVVSVMAVVWEVAHAHH